MKKEQVRHIDFSEKRIPIKLNIYIHPAKFAQFPPIETPEKNIINFDLSGELAS